MIDGTYAVEAKTPLGVQQGTLVLSTDQDVCNAELNLAGKTAHAQGDVQGDAVTFTGSIKLPFPIGSVDYVLSGTVEGDALQATFSAKKFTFDVTGTRVA